MKSTTKSQIEIKLFSTPREATEDDLRGCMAIVIDVLRSSATITAALANGAREIIPVPTPAEEVEQIKAQISASEETEKPKVNFEVGETIKINNGPFLNFSGVIEEIEPDRGKLKVTVNIFGRNTPVELEYWQVEKG